MISQSTKSLGGLRLKFQITQSLRDEKLMRSLIQYLGCGNFYYNRTSGIGNLVVLKHSDITDKIIPLFNHNPILGVKSRDFEN